MHCYNYLHMNAFECARKIMKPSKQTQDARPVPMTADDRRTVNIPASLHAVLREHRDRTGVPIERMTAEAVRAYLAFGGAR